MLRISDTEILAPDQHQWVYKVKRQRKRDGKTESYWRKNLQPSKTYWVTTMRS
jgi:hypothetical protein